MRHGRPDPVDRVPEGRAGGSVSLQAKFGPDAGRRWTTTFHLDAPHQANQEPPVFQRPETQDDVSPSRAQGGRPPTPSITFGMASPLT